MGLSPQELVIVSFKLPIEKLSVIFNAITFVPCPEIIVVPSGTDHI